MKLEGGGMQGCGRVQEEVKRRIASRYDLNTLLTYMKLQKNAF